MASSQSPVSPSPFRERYTHFNNFPLLSASLMAHSSGARAQRCRQTVTFTLSERHRHHHPWLPPRATLALISVPAMPLETWWGWDKRRRGMSALGGRWAHHPPPLPALLMAPPYPQLCLLQHKHLDAFWTHRMERKRADISVPSALLVNEGIRNYNPRFAF